MGEAGSDEVVDVGGAPALPPRPGLGDGAVALASQGPEMLTHDGSPAPAVDGAPMSGAPSLPPRPPDPRQDRDPGRVGPPPAYPAPGPPVVTNDYVAAVDGRPRVTEVPEPVPLHSSTAAKVLFAIAALLGTAMLLGAVPLRLQPPTDRTVLIVQGLGIAAGGLVGLAAMIWSCSSVANARRLLAHSRRRSTVSGWRMLLWWLAIPLIAVPLLVGALLFSEHILEPAITPDRDADVIRAFVVIGWAVVALVLWMRPYLYLASIARRVHADPKLFSRWLWLPTVFTVASGLGVVLVALTGFANDAPQFVAYLAVLVGSVVPYATWCWCGWKALSSLDETMHGMAAGQRERRARYLQTELGISGGGSAEVAPAEPRFSGPLGVPTVAPPPAAR